MSEKKKKPVEGAENVSIDQRYIVIYGYSHDEISVVLGHFAQALPPYIDIHHSTYGMLTHITLVGTHKSVEILRFKLNRLRQSLVDLFPHEVIATENVTPAQILGQLLSERELTVSFAESCTGGNLAHRIVQVPGSSNYFLGSVVSYSNDVKANVLDVSRSDLEKYGAVSQKVVEAMAIGVCKLMRSDCGIATSGIAGPDGGTALKPIGTVWIAVKWGNTLVTECMRFSGDRNEVIESATNHAMVMLINLLRHIYIMQEDFNDE